MTPSPRDAIDWSTSTPGPGTASPSGRTRSRPWWPHRSARASIWADGATAERPACASQMWGPRRPRPPSVTRLGRSGPVQAGGHATVTQQAIAAEPGRPHASRHFAGPSRKGHRASTSTRPARTGFELLLLGAGIDARSRSSTGFTAFFRVVSKRLSCGD